MCDMDAEFAQGYRDGRCPDTPEPNSNRHPAYIHSFKVGRGEINGTPIPVAISRAAVAKIEKEHGHD